MFYYTYKITCTEGKFKDKIYFGQHTTDNLNDGYKGSGVIVKRYYSRHPNGYKKEILQFYANRDELNKAEYELIHPHLGKDYCLNLVEGGSAFSGDANPFYGKHHTEETKELIKEKRGIYYSTHDGYWKDKHLSKEAKEKISKTRKEKGLAKGENNPMYGTHRCGEKNPFYGMKHTEETKQKKRKPILQYDLDGNLIKEYSCLDEAVKCGFTMSGVSTACNNNKIYKGFIWKHK